MITLIVTGVGGPLGQALIKAARQASFTCRLVGTDRSDLAVGFRWVERAVVLPDASNEVAYLRHMEALCAEENAHAVLTASDAELRLLSAHKEAIEERVTARMIVASPAILATCLDKLETCRFLAQQRLAFPDYAAAEDSVAVERLAGRFGYPLIAKPRVGSGSRGVITVRNQADAAYVAGLDREYVIQEYLRPDDQEYTVGVFISRDGDPVGAICLRREIMGGTTYRAWAVDEPEVAAEATRVAEALGIRGPCNVQLRKTARGPVTFEINPRFSGTAGIRAHFGFNEVEMAIRSFVLGEPLSPPVVKPGVALRYWEEHYL